LLNVNESFVCIPVSPLVWCFKVGLHVITELNRASCCIAGNSDYFEVVAVSIVMMS